MTISDLQAEIRALCDADSTSLTDATLLRRVNAAYEEVVGWIINSDGVWQFDDTNYTTNPIGTIDLVAGQSQYSFTTAFLDIENVKVKDTNGNWHILDTIDQSQTSIALEDYLSTDGQPTMYDKNADGLRLYPAPAASAVTLTAGLKIQFKRTASIYTSAEVTTGTKQPGFASPYHIILAYMAAIPYCLSYKQNRVAPYQLRVDRLKAEIIKFYGQREKDRRKVFTMEESSFR